MTKKIVEKKKVEQTKEPKPLKGKSVRFILVNEWLDKIISTPLQYSMMLQACEKAETSDEDGSKKIGTGKALTAIKKGLYKGKAKIIYVKGSDRLTTEGSRVKFLSSTKEINWDDLNLSKF